MNVNAATRQSAVKIFQQKTPDSVIELARDLKQQKEYAKELKDNLAGINNEIMAKEQQLYNLMKENGIEGLKIDGKNLFPQSQYWASIPEYIEDDGFSQLEKLGLESLIKRKVNTQTLSAEMRRRIDEGEIVVQSESNANIWVWAKGPLQGQLVCMNISEVKKIGMRKA